MNWSTNYTETAFFKDKSLCSATTRIVQNSGSTFIKQIAVAVTDSTGKLIMESILETEAATILQFFAGFPFIDREINLRIRRRGKMFLTSPFIDQAFSPIGSVLAS